MHSRKFLTVFLVVCLLLSCVACSKKKKKPTATTAPMETSSTAPTETTSQNMSDMDKNYPVDAPYDYPVRPGSAQWAALTDAQRHAACQVPEDLLPRMTTRALVETLLNYPLWPNFYAYPYAAEGYANVFANCSAMQTLATRANTKYIIQTYFSDDLWRLNNLLYYGIDYTDNSVYEFPVAPGSVEWTAMSAAEQIAACQIPEEKLAHMSTEALFVTILNYPNMQKLLADGSNEATFEDLVAEFNGLQEFLQRPNQKAGFDCYIYLGDDIAPYAKDYELQLLKKLNFYIPCE